MCLGFRTGERAIAWVTRVDTNTTIELSDSAYALDDFLWTESSILVVETVSGAVRSEHVKLHEVDVLAHRVGRCAHLEVVLNVNTWDEIRVLESDAVVCIGAEEKRLGRTCAIQSRFHVAPTTLKCAIAGNAMRLC